MRLHSTRHTFGWHTIHHPSPLSMHLTPSLQPAGTHPATIKPSSLVFIAIGPPSIFSNNRKSGSNAI